MKNVTDSMRSSRFGVLGILAMALSFPACVQVKTEPIRIEPIYIEITINHRVQKELDDFFGDVDKASQTADFVPFEATEPK